MNVLWSIGIALAMALQQEAAPANSSAQDSASEIVTESALADFIHDVNVPVREPGILEHISVKAGDWVEANQTIAELDRKLYELDFQASTMKQRISEFKATDDVDMRYSAKSKEVAGATLARSQAAVVKFPTSISATEIEQLRLELERATLSIEKAEFERKLSGYEAELNASEADAAQHKLELRSIKTPIAGFVVEVQHHEGEWVNAGQTVARVLQLDRMRIKGFLPSNQINQSFIGRCAIFESNVDGAKYEGTIHFVSPEVELNLEKVEFWFDVDNPDRKLRRSEVGRVRIPSAPK